MDYQEPLFFHVMQYAAASDGDVIDMVSGNPDWEAPPALAEGLREYADGGPEAFQYPPSEGLLELREEIAARRDVDVDQVVVTDGAGEANYLAIARALERNVGDVVVLVDPVYPYYPGKTRMLGGAPRYVAAERDGHLDPERVRETVDERTAAIVVNTPNNPTGAVYDARTMSTLVEVAEDVDALLISDEVYDHFDYHDQFVSALSVDSTRRIVTNAFSKSMAITGFRVGYGIFPSDLVAAAKTRHMLTNVAGSRPAQAAVLHALRNTPPDYFRRTRNRLRQRLTAFTDALDAAGAEYTTPDGAFYVLCRFEGFPGTLDNVKRLIDEAGVAGMPGETFGEDRADWLRFALVSHRSREAAERLASYFS